MAKLHTPLALLALALLLPATSSALASTRPLPLAADASDQETHVWGINLAAGDGVWASTARTPGSHLGISLSGWEVASDRTYAANNPIMYVDPNGLNPGAAGYVPPRPAPGQYWNVDALQQGQWWGAGAALAVGALFSGGEAAAAWAATPSGYITLANAAGVITRLLDESGGGPSGGAGKCEGQAPLRILHPRASMSPSSLKYWSGQTTEKIVESLSPGGGPGLPLSVKIDGTVMQGNTRLSVLLDRGFDINSLPRVPYTSTPVDW